MTSRRTDRNAGYTEPSRPAAGEVEVDSLGAGDRFIVVGPLSDTAGGHVGATGSVIWTNDGFPVAQLGDGTVLNLLEDDVLDLPPETSSRGMIPLLTIAHDRTMWNEGFEHDIYIQLPAAELEVGIRLLVEAHNQKQTAFDRSFEVSVRVGPWEGPDLDPATALRIIVEALNEWKGI